MKIEFDVSDKKRIKMLYKSKRFLEYPKYYLSNVCTVRVNKDEYLFQDEFTIYCKSKILPRKVYIYGKKAVQNVIDDNNLYLNYWIEIFLKTIEKGNLYKKDFEKSNLKSELTIGIPYELRKCAYNHTCWTRANIIEFISCLFNMPVEEINYEQQDIFETMVAA